jgi:uncharacterized membrane protein YbhN (UPF0104 family)
MSPSKLLTLIFTYSIVGLSLVLVFLLLSENEDEINELLINTIGGIIGFLFVMIVISNWRRFMSKLNRRVAAKRRSSNS